MSLGSVGEVGLDLKVNGKDYKKQIKSYGDYGSNHLESSFGKTFKNIGKMAIAAFSIKAIVDFTRSCLSLGSALTEVENITAVAFPGMNKQMDEFAKNAASQFGLSETMAKRFTGMYGTMAKQFGYSTQEAFKMGSTLAGLAGDVASFYDMTQDEAYVKLKAVFSGETEVLKDIGIVMTQAALDQYALANSYGKTTAKMSEQEKVALRFAFVQEQLSAATGDFVRTQDSWANQTRLLSLQFDSLKASLGKGFIALFTPIVKGINWVLSNLQSLADSFANLMQMLTGYSGDSGGGALADTSGDISNATDGAGGLSDGLTDAGKSGEKAAKKIQKAFSKVDTINKLTFGSDEESDDGSGGTGESVSDAVEFPEATKEASVFEGMLNGIFNEFNRLADLFKIGFTIGFGNSFDNINRIKEYIASIGSSIFSIFNDPMVQNASRGWLDSLYLYWGKSVGSFASIGVSIATLVTGSIADYLNQSGDFIKSQLTRWFELGSVRMEIIGNFQVVLADIISVFASPTAVSIGGNLISIILDSAMGLINLFDMVGVGILRCILEPINNNAELIKTSIENTLKPIKRVTDTIAQSVRDTFTKIGQVYDEHVKPGFDRMTEGLTNILSSFLKAYNQYIAPVVDFISVKFSEMWHTYIQPAIDSIIVFIGKFVELFSTIVDKFLAPFIDWLLGTLAPQIGNFVKSVWLIIEPIVSMFAGVIKGIMDMLGSLMDFLIGIFTGDWERAWEGFKGIFSNAWLTMSNFVDGIVKTISNIITIAMNGIKSAWESVWNGISGFFGGIWSGIGSTISTAINNVKTTIVNVLGTIKSIWDSVWTSIGNFVSNTWNWILGIFNSGGRIFDGIVGGIESIFRNIVNSILRGMNTIIRGPLNFLNNILNTIRNISVLGAKPFKGMWGPNPIPVPQIPLLAQGGYVGANQPQLAMIGDNKRYGEIVAPEDKMLDMINTALKMQKESGSINGLDKVIVLIKDLIEAVNGLVLKVDIDTKKLSILLENAQKERAMIGG